MNKVTKTQCLKKQQQKNSYPQECEFVLLVNMKSTKAIWNFKENDSVVVKRLNSGSKHGPTTSESDPNRLLFVVQLIVISGFNSIKIIVTNLRFWL